MRVLRFLTSCTEIVIVVGICLHQIIHCIKCHAILGHTLLVVHSIIFMNGCIPKVSKGHSKLCCVCRLEDKWRKMLSLRDGYGKSSP